jgi:ubiquinone/menaquinone biosynthesis C-methylase UbiE
MNKIADYDTLNYDYKQYWKNREYENSAEQIALEKLLINENGTWFIDIGGSFGRLTPTYYKKYKNCIILDYSLNTLQNNYEYIKKNFPNTIMIAADAYHLPFKDDSFDVIMVRVLNLIEKQKNFLQRHTEYLTV